VHHLHLWNLASDVPALLGGAVLLGMLMGALLGTAQTLVLRHRVVRPWRWTAASTLAWAAAMPVIFLGAAIASPGTPVAALVLLGTVTGAAAGTVLGLVSGWFLLLLDRDGTHRGRHGRYRPAHDPGRSR
jgi:hypothetical protein